MLDLLDTEGERSPSLELLDTNGGGPSLELSLSMELHATANKHKTSSRLIATKSKQEKVSSLDSKLN